MADGFTVTETIAAAPEEVWDYLVDFRNAGQWMPGIDDMSQTTPGPVEVGTNLTFDARGKQRASQVSDLDPGQRLALTSTQGGVTATYTYSVAPSDAGTEMTLHAVCRATGFWKLLHPLIVFAMRKSDGPQLSNLKAVIEGQG